VVKKKCFAGYECLLCQPEKQQNRRTAKPQNCRTVYPWKEFAMIKKRYIFAVPVP
jgi:hypothetical protein